ncbi:hypothetical protein B0J13DRAFT_458317 [Dactylonectria estremocensis]|uniref:Fungal N-terminal domain-containing protein n=1 Tax=Dactylonectria estremocensis TaxID=1079267 RepID=A0A9P9DDN7_9HYPO|nr:hypothetical protein B0J13DRAFT_458317 [Dactylonectria estremocensis]
MAEALGIAAGVAGFISLLVQINSGIETLRDIRKQVDGAPSELGSLTQELQFLADIMQRVIQSTPSRDASALQHCQTSCDEVVILLNSLKKKFLDASQEHGPRRIIKILAFRQWKEAVDDLHRGIQAAKINLTLVCVLRSNTQVEELLLVNKLHLSQSTSAGPKEERPTMGHVPVPSEAPIPLIPAVCRARGVRGMSIYRHINTRQRRNCFTKRCSCSCHRTSKLSGRFWALQYTPLAAFQETCDIKPCAGSCYGISLRAVFSQFGIRWATVVDLHILNKEGKVFLRPALGFQPVVPYTSPGFELIWRVNWGELTAREAQKGLARLAREDPSFTWHVNPAGVGYLESTLSHFYRMRLTYFDVVIQICLYLSNAQTAVDQALTLLRNRIVGSCASIRGLSSRDKILDVLLASGLEPTEVGAGFAEHLNPITTTIPADLHLGFLRKLCSHDHGFADMTNLHTAALAGSADYAEQLMASSVKHPENPLGQTPMHLAVHNLELIRALIRHGYDINASDLQGLTPLAYAATLNQKEVVHVLLDAGADPSSYSACSIFPDPLWVARVKGHWDLVISAIQKMGKLGWEQQVRDHCRRGIEVLLQPELPYPDTTLHRCSGRLTALSRLLTIWGHWRSKIHGDGEYSLISRLLRVEDLQVFVDHGYNIATHTDSRGMNALSLIQSCHRLLPLDLAERLAKLGVDVNHQDNLFHTPLRQMFMLETQRSQAYILRNMLESVPTFLQLGADATHRDRCRCSCDPQGCKPTAAFDVTGWFFADSPEFAPPLFALEFIHSLREHEGISVSKLVLLSFIRRVKHHEMGMTHVCCHRNLRRGIYSCDEPLNDEDADDILEEESDFVEILDHEMNQLAHQGYGHLMQQWFLQIDHLRKVHLARTGQNDKVLILRRVSFFNVHTKRNRRQLLFVAG